MIEVNLPMIGLLNCSDFFEGSLEAAGEQRHPHEHGTDTHAEHYREQPEKLATDVFRHAGGYSYRQKPQEATAE